MRDINHNTNEVVCQLTESQVDLILSWFYAYPFSLSEESKSLASFLGECVGEYDIPMSL